jgi:hypothetical protein
MSPCRRLKLGRRWPFLLCLATSMLVGYGVHHEFGQDGVKVWGLREMVQCRCEIGSASFAIYPIGL